MESFLIKNWMTTTTTTTTTTRSNNNGWCFKTISAEPASAIHNLRFRSINFGRYQRRGGSEKGLNFCRGFRWWSPTNFSVFNHGVEQQNVPGSNPPADFFKKHQQASFVVSPDFKRTHHNWILSLHTLCRSVELSFWSCWQQKRDLFRTLKPKAL